MSAVSLIGHVFLGRYRALLQLGVGGMGSVYLARTEGAAGFSKPVVVKLIRQELLGDSSVERRFIREAKILSKLSHQSIVNVVDFGREPAGYVLVLEYIHGYDLGQWHQYLSHVGKKQLPVDLALHIAIKVLKLLHYVHSRTDLSGTPLGIVHRDISPSNILLTEDGQIRVADFGIARSSNEQTERTTEGAFVGKTAYAAPELLEGGKPTPFSDCFAVAIVLYKLLSGTHPFHGKIPANIIMNILQSPVPSIEAVRKDIPSGLDSVLCRALAKIPENRFANAEAFAEALKPLLRSPEEDLMAQLSSELTADFRALPQVLGVSDLRVRESSWTDAVAPNPNPSQDAPSVQRETFPTAIPTVDISPAARLSRSQPEPIAQKTTSRRPMILATIVLISVVCLGLGSAYAFRSKNDSDKDPGFVLVKTRTQPPTQAASYSPPATEPLSATETLGQAVRQAQPKFHKCFVEHVQDVEDNPQITLRFELQKNKRIANAHILPESLAKKPAGECLKRVAAEIQFPPQTEDLSFRVPLTAKVSVVE